jgi:UDP-GlcNAc:undecaprenyl-phosphate GlcNAc-1-phosphate transferase
MVLAIPLLDTGLAIARRFLRRQPIFGADRGHIHHKLLARGLTPRRVVLLMYGVCGVGAGLSLLFSVFHDHYGGVIIILFCAGAWIGIQHLGYAEFGMAGRLLRPGTFRRLLSAQLELGSFSDDLKAAATPDQHWEVLRAAYSDFGFNEIELKLGGQAYRHTTNGHHIANIWTIRIPLSGDNSVTLSREFDTQAPPVIAPFVDTIGKVMLPKMPGMPAATRQPDPPRPRDLTVKIRAQRAARRSLIPNTNQR